MFSMHMFLDLLGLSGKLTCGVCADCFHFTDSKLGDAAQLTLESSFAADAYAKARSSKIVDLLGRTKMMVQFRLPRIERFDQ
jgi:hypothetical protein